MILEPPYKVVLIDDQKANLMIMENNLKEVQDICIQSFCDPHEAFNEIEENGANIVVTDLMMPQMRGDDLIRKINKLKKGTIVVVVSSKETFVDSFTCFRLGARDYLFKPTSKDELIDCIERIKLNLGRWKSVITNIAERHRAS
jgi:two-component system, response regulator YesN